MKTDCSKSHHCVALERPFFFPPTRVQIMIITRIGDDAPRHELARTQNCSPMGAPTASPVSPCPTVHICTKSRWGAGAGVASNGPETTLVIFRRVFAVKSQMLGGDRNDFLQRILAHLFFFFTLSLRQRPMSQTGWVGQQPQNQEQHRRRKETSSEQVTCLMLLYSEVKCIYFSQSVSCHDRLMVLV